MFDWLDEGYAGPANSPRLNGTDLTVSRVVALLLSGVTLTQMTKTYPGVPRTAFIAAVDYAFRLATATSLARAESVVGIAVMQPEKAEKRVAFVRPSQVHLSG